jgi:hypothetical protein
MKVRNISYKEYLELSSKEEFNFYLRNGNFEPVDIFKIGSFFDAEFGFVKDMQENFNDAFFSWDEYLKEISKFKNISMIELGKYSIFNIQQSILFCIEELKKINEFENKNLGHVPTHEEIEAGIDVFDKYKSFSQFDSLTCGDILKIDSIREVQYSICIMKLMLDADSHQFDLNMTKIKSRT